MTSIAKLKDRARKHEQKEDWQAAIAAYQKVLEAQEGEDEVELELGLYNRVGDLYLRLGQTDAAVRYYEQAADKYAESGFFNNAIALCNKALRHRPERTLLYLKLSHLCSEQGFFTDARRWIIEYAQRQVKAGHVAEALAGLEEFAESSDDADVREFLAQQLVAHDRPDEALEQLRRAHESVRARGDADAATRLAEKAREIDPEARLGAAAADAEDEVPEFAAERRMAEPEEMAPSSDEDGGLEGLETHREELAPEEAQSESLGGLETFDTGPADRETDEAEPLPLLDSGYEDDEDDEDEEEEAGAEPLPLLASDDEDEDEDEALDAEDAEPLPLLEGSHPGGDEVDDDGYGWTDEPDTAAVDAEAPEEAAEEVAEDVPDEVGEDVPAAGDEPEPDRSLGAADAPGGLDLSIETAGGSNGWQLDELVDESGVLRPGDDAMDLDELSLDLGVADGGAGELDVEESLDSEAVLGRARELVSRGLADEALRELRLLTEADGDPDLYRQAVSITKEVIRHDPNDIPALQRRVEFSVRSRDRGLLVEAYMDLANALARLGAETKAQAMYERVLDLDPENEAAREAVGPLDRRDETPVDLDAILRELESSPADDDDAATGTDGEAGSEGDPSFEAMLSQFKAKVTEQVNAREAGDHYDLGLAFKEMGLVDEAIAEFQTALTGGEERLKVYEELGQCFVLKGQFTVALKIFHRALQVPYEDDSELLGVYYHLGQCYEELGQRAEAREAYEKVLSIDESFADVPDRVARL